jgi:F-type H+-transporting ATPase subunit b
MKKILIAAAFFTSPSAFAQENGTTGNAGEVSAPPGGDPSAQPPTLENREKARLGAEAAGHMHPEDGDADEAEDPSQHFNFTNFSYRGKDEFGGPFGDGVMEEKDANGNTVRVIKEEEPMSAPFVLMLLNFGVLLIILGKYGAPVARKVASDRHDQIKNALDEAAKLRGEAQKKLTELETRIKGVDGEIKKLVDDIRASAESDKQRILEQAQAQSAQMKRDAELRIAAEIETARAQLTKEVTAAATAATEQLLREKLTADDQNKLVSTFIANVAAGSKPQERS